MNAMYSLVMVFTLVVIALLGAGAMGMQTFFALCLPATAMLVFVLGFAWRMIDWAKRPVPFSIPTTGGQMHSVLPWVKQAKLDNPSTKFQTTLRMILEVFTFRSLFRNTKVTLFDGPKVAYPSNKFLWLAAILFHYSFLVIVLRHMRLFLEPVPMFVNALEFGDGLFQIGAPVLYLTDIFILAGLTFLLMRRLVDSRLRYISLPADYFPLFLIIGICLSGVYMRYVGKVDVVAIKDVAMSIVAFKAVPADVWAKVDAVFFVHVMLVSTLLIYFPFSKLMHMGGVFLSPTRNLPNDSRMKHYVNPWNKPGFTCHTYEAYEDEFREPMHEAGLPLDKPFVPAEGKED